MIDKGEIVLQPLCTDDEQYKIIRKKLKKDLERKRYVHTKGVAASAVCLAMAYGYDMKKAYLAALSTQEEAGRGEACFASSVSSSASSSGTFPISFI